MNIGQFISEVRAAGITLYVRDGKLRSRAEKGALTPEIERRIRERKDALIAWLSEAGVAQEGRDWIPVVPRGAPLPLSFAQQRLWFFEQVEGGTAAYNVAFALRVAGQLDIEAVRRSFQTLIERHEALRTHFEQNDGQPVQVPHAQATVEIPLDDLSAWPLEEREREMLARCRSERLTPIDLTRPPLIRVRLIRMRPSEHVLALTMHHIVSDGWSQAVLTREFVAAYEAHSSGGMPYLPTLPIQYADYACWQRLPEQAARIQHQLDYWKRTLAALAPVLELPTDRPRRARQSYRGGTHSFRIDAAQTRRLTELSRSRGATLFIGVLSLFNVLLHRYSGCIDIAVGTPVAGRNHRALEGLIGAFSNTLVLRSQVNGTQSFLEHLDHVCGICLEAYENQDVPFEQLVEAIRPERSLSHAPLVQVKLVFENVPGGGAGLRGLSVSPVPVASPYSKFDLLLSVTPVAGGLACHLEYSSDLFDDHTTARMVAHFQRLLTAALAQPRRPIAALEMLDAAEHAQAVRAWNRLPDRAYAEPSTVHGLVEAHARRYPRRIALICEGERMDYDTLNRRANRLARWLRAAGVGAGDRVGVCLERGFDLPIAILAAAKAGAAYVPIDPAFPADHAGYVIDDAGIALVITHSSVRAHLPAGSRAVHLDALVHECGTLEQDDLGCAVSPLAPVYIIHTSGSTGRPKGVCVPHHALCNYVRNMLERLTLSQDAQFATLATIAADLGNTAVFGALCGGYALRLLPQAASMDSAALARSLTAEPIDCLKIVPSHLAGLLAHSEPAALLPRQALVFGGEALKRDLIDTVREHGPACRIYNHYGPTETTVGTVMMELQAGDACDEGVPIGRPLASTTAYVLDRYLNPVPPGVPGELYIGGEGVAHGYWRRAALTAERFVPDPFAERAGARLYATGDKVRWRGDGALMFLGRTDEQLNIRGFRVEPHSVRAVLLEHPQVQDAAVVAQADAYGGPCMAAYVVARTPVGADALLSHLRARLPEYMSPAGIVFLDALPVTPNGKIDARALPPLTFSGNDETGEAPQGEIEVAVAACWREVLPVETLCRDERFFAIGGHSLLAMLVIARLRQRFDVELTVQHMFEVPTVRGLATCIAALRAAGAPVESYSDIGRRDRATACPLSAAQQRLWFLSQLEGPSSTYNMPVALRIRGTLDVGALIDSLREIVRRHEILRTCYRASESGVEQCVMAPDAFAIDLAVQSLDEANLLNEVAATARMPFDLARDYMLRARLWRIGDHEHVLAVTLHHIACDGWSLSILVNELASLYAARAHGRTASLPELPLQYGDYAAWQHDHLRSGALQRQVTYWRERLRGTPELLELPYDRARLAEQDFRGDERDFALPRATVDALNAIARERDVTLYMLLLAAFKLLLARYSGRNDILVGSPVAGRSRPQLEGLIGFFVNTLVLRTRIDPQARFAAVLEAVKGAVLEAFEHQDVPYEQLVEALQPTRSLSYAPLVQVMFSLQKLPSRELGLAGVELSPIPVRNHVAKFDLSLILSETADGLRGTLEYGAALFSADRMDRLLAHYRCILERIASGSDLPLRRLWAPTEEEFRQLEAHNRSALAPYANVPVHKQVERQAARAPEAVAVVGPGGQLSYAQLEARATALAAHLRAARFTRDNDGGQARVALCVERDVDLPVGMLAILKAGAIYAPIDLANPRERIAQMLGDAQPACVVTHRSLCDLFGDLPTVCMDEELHVSAESASGSSVDDPTSCPDLGAYIIFTSGSTGVPKGVLVAHRALANLSYATQARLCIGPGDRVLQFAAPGFDVSLWETFMTLCWGGTVYLAPRDQLLPGHDLLAYLQRHGITRLALTASALAATPCDALPDLRTVISGGEICSAELVRRWQPGREFHNVYGPTEAGICATMGLCHAGDTEPTIGNVFANVECHVLDERLERLPVGVWGELYIGGAGLAHGYWRRAGLTAASFLPDPYSGRAGARLYRTGDRVRKRADGRIEYHSRIDDQVKLRGFRVELGEIESLLLQHPAVAEAAVAVHCPARGTEQLVGYFVPADADASADLRRFLAARLPSYMVPATLVSVQQLPRTGNGKIDRALLRPPTASDLVSSHECIAPSTATESWLAALWETLLGVQRVGVSDDFFALGGHSLLATQMVARVAGQYRAQIPVREVFANPTLRGFAEVVDAARGCIDGDEAGLIAQLEAMSEEEAVALVGQAVAGAERRVLEH